MGTALTPTLAPIPSTLAPTLTPVPYGALPTPTPTLVTPGTPTLTVGPTAPGQGEQQAKRFGDLFLSVYVVQGSKENEGPNYHLVTGERDFDVMQL
ncbi:hypothetical protein PPTG_22390 [Phytophthora nicotianae INRA-310]|uniref:Uncharacterized protein n=1 Tax=Phytophthora nicotianae (strain INRA-310) TaxID=761204 RepID=W2QHN2_PHYN3|nr:hypothetical protein PPTG_22390 [Phytophthora nicotianae INRA-310]ETN12693.1 hypothetical protein PPTG_22390 [Phytophthora nicotianae INRA-310]